MFIRDQSFFMDMPSNLAAIILILISVSLTLSVSFVNLVQGKEQKLAATLSGDQEVPPNTSTVIGWAWFNPIGDKIEYHVYGLIDNATMAHIHEGQAGENGDPVALLEVAPFSIGNIASGYITDSNLMSSLAGSSVSDLVDKMRSGQTYINVHTGVYPDGEIRGQISTKSINSCLDFMMNQTGCMEAFPKDFKTLCLAKKIAVCGGS